MSLCSTCREGLVIEREAGTRFTWCHVAGAGFRVPNDIVKCSDYNDKRFTSQYEMERVGWTLRTDKTGHAIGFTPPQSKP